MKNLIDRYWRAHHAVIMMILILFSCTKSDDIIVQGDSNKRLVEILALENGMEHSREQFQYHDGKLCMHYASQWNDMGQWDRRSRTIYHCWSGNFMATEYTGSDLSWLPENELWVKFENEKPFELIQYGYHSDILQMQALQKWIYTYDEGNLISCELKAYEEYEWRSILKTENRYDGKRLTEIKTYSYRNDCWTLTGLSEFEYDLDLAKEIRKFSLHEDKWILKEKYEFQYSGSLLSACLSHKADESGDLRIDCTTHYKYDESQTLIYQCCSTIGNIVEKFYLYEDSCGNYSCTLGEICTAINFPLQLPNPI